MADVDFDAEITTLPPPPIVSSYMIGEVQLLPHFLIIFLLLSNKHILQLVNKETTILATKHMSKQKFNLGLE
jgi:hypothetical protein